MQSAIKFLGVGGAFNPEAGNSSAIINTQGVNILLDCGYTVYPKLLRDRLSKKIDYVLISHLHNDHVGSLSTYIYHHSLIIKKGKLKILYQTETFKNLLADYLRFSIPQLDLFVEFVPLSIFPNLIAFDTYGLHVPDFQSYAFCLESSGKRYLFSGDIADPTFVKQVMKPQENDIIFHEMVFRKGEKAHTYYKDLQAQLMGYEVYGYHNRPELKPADLEFKLVIECKDFLA